MYSIFSSSLEFTPLEFETSIELEKIKHVNDIRIYSVGVWNIKAKAVVKILSLLEFTPLEFETSVGVWKNIVLSILEFTPLEFETFFTLFFISVTGLH